MGWFLPLPLTRILAYGVPQTSCCRGSLACAVTQLEQALSRQSHSSASRRFPEAEPRLEASSDPLRAEACEPQAKEHKRTGSTRTYWLDACFRNSSSVCLKVSRRHLFTVFSTLTASPARQGKQHLKPC